MNSKNMEQIKASALHQNQPEPAPELPVAQEEGKEQDGKYKEYELVVCDALNNIEVKYPLKQGIKTTVGADPSCSIQIVNDPCVSSNHISITANGDDVIAEDIGSRNGSFLKLEGPTQVQPGAFLLTGKTLLIVEERVDADSC